MLLLILRLCKLKLIVNGRRGFVTPYFGADVEKEEEGRGELVMYSSPC